MEQRRWDDEKVMQKRQDRDSVLTFCFKGNGTP